MSVDLDAVDPGGGLCRFAADRRREFAEELGGRLARLGIRPERASGVLGETDGRSINLELVLPALLLGLASLAGENGAAAAISRFGAFLAASCKALDALVDAELGKADYPFAAVLSEALFADAVELLERHGGGAEVLKSTLEARTEVALAGSVLRSDSSDGDSYSRLAGRAARFRHPIVRWSLSLRRDLDPGALVCAVDAIAVGNQLVDDLVDWEADLAAGRSTHLLSRAEPGPGEGVEAAIVRILPGYLSQLKDEYRRAGDLASEYGAPLLAAYCRELQSRIGDLQTAFE